MTTKTTRARITVDSLGDVTVTWSDPTDLGPTTTTYTCPTLGGYVRIRDAQGRMPQVCERLSSSGDTLRASSRDALPALIRREHARRVAAWRRMASR